MMYKERFWGSVLKYMVPVIAFLTFPFWYMMILHDERAEKRSTELDDFVVRGDF